MGTICQWKVYDRGTFSVKNGMQKGKGLDLGGQGWGRGFPPGKKALFSIYLPSFTMRNWLEMISRFR